MPQSNNVISIESPSKLFDQVTLDIFPRSNSIMHLQRHPACLRILDNAQLVELIISCFNTILQCCRCLGLDYTCSLIVHMCIHDKEITQVLHWALENTLAGTTKKAKSRIVDVERMDSFEFYDLHGLIESFVLCEAKKKKSRTSGTFIRLMLRC